MNKINAYIEQFFPLIKNIFMPALLFALSLICFYALHEISVSSLTTLHCSFYIISFISFMILLYFNQRKPAFYILMMLLSYILINILKNKYNQDYATTSYYISLCFFLPLNLLAFYFIPDNRLLCRTNVFLLLAIFLQFSIGEILGRYDFRLNLTLFDGHLGNLSSLGLIFFIITLTTFFIKASKDGFIMNYALFFCSLNLLFGFIYSDNPTALTIFFCCAALTLMLAIIHSIYYNTYKDALTGLPSRNSYIIQSNSFPLKYSIGVVSIDNYNNMKNIFGKKDRDILVRMIAGKIIEEFGEEHLYRYSADEFILIFKNENKNESFEHLEQIRRAIASAEFVLSNRRKSIKLTVSTCVSEKKRSDANSIEVLYRIRKKKKKANEFSHNISSKA